MKPQTFMNLSGEAVATVARYFKIPVAEVLVVSDDTALPLGRLRLRPGGSDGGHNGLRSIIDHLDTSDFPRLRIGVGAAQSGEMVPHVLGRFSPDEEKTMQAAISRAADAVEVACTHGLQRAMNEFNRSDEASAPPSPPESASGAVTN